MTPRRYPHITLKPLGSEAMLYDPARDRVVRLNPTSRRLWELADGTRDSQAIAQALAEEFSGARLSAVLRDVEQTIASMQQASLLEPDVQSG